ncbi:MAG TPA: head-tail connector protein [Brevibacterium sp.]|nr:head-tail connector protein [Brevibacterium sp.]
MTTVRVPSAGPVVEPVSLEEAKRHCRIDYDEEDDLIEALIPAAREHCEVVTRLTLAPATWEARLAAFPAGPIALPHPPLLEVEGVRYVDAGGAEVELGADAYTVERLTMPGTLAPVGRWPAGRSVRIRYRAGYEGGQIPHAARQAILLLVGHWYEHREAVVTGTIATTVPLAVDRLLWGIRHYEVA